MTVTEVAGKRVVLMGLGRFGGQIAAARYVASRGGKLLITDGAPAEKLADSLAQLSGLSFETRLGEHREEDFASADLIVTSPAVAPSSPYLSAARAAGVPVVTEIELTVERILARNPGQLFVGVTGTKGKSTTTAMLGRMMQARHKTHVGGNIGRPLINEVESIGADDWVLLELSSYMLHYLGARGFAPRVGVVTLISSDHIEWHGGLENYHEAKRNLLRHQGPGDHAVIYRGNSTAASFAAATKGTVHWYDAGSAAPLEMRLPGEHNQLNAQGALAAAKVLGVPEDLARAAVRDFGGLPHRLELVGTIRPGVSCYNDSIATIPEAAVAALRSFPAGRVLQIVGGSDKGLDMTPLTDELAARAKLTLCVGLIGTGLHEKILAAGGRSEYVGTLEAAVKRAGEAGSAGDVLLLSPGTASYDQYPNFEARGEAFRKLVGSMGPK